MTSRYSCRLHFCFVFLVLVTLLVFMTEAPLLGKDLVWAASCPLFTGDFDSVTKFSTSPWSEGMLSLFIHATSNVTWVILCRHSHNVNGSEFQVSQAPKETSSHGWEIGSGHSRYHMLITVSNAYRPCFPLVTSFDTLWQRLMHSCAQSAGQLLLLLLLLLLLILLLFLLLLLLCLLLYCEIVLLYSHNWEKGSTICDSWSLLSFLSSFPNFTFLTMNLCSDFTAEKQGKNLQLVGR